MKGHLEITMTLGRGQKPNLEQAGSLFGQAAETMGIQANEGKIDSARNSLRIRVDGVTGITDVDTPISASFLPGSLKRAGMLDITVIHHPDGPAGAEKLANSLAERIAAAFVMDLRDNSRRVKTKRQGCKVLIPANGWNDQFSCIFADFKPGGAT